MYKKYSVAIFVFLFIITPIFSIDITITGYGDEITLTDTKIAITDDYYSDDKEEYQITWENKNGISYIHSIIQERPLEKIYHTV